MTLVVTHVDAEQHPLRQVELHPEPARARDAARPVLVGSSGALDSSACIGTAVASIAAGLGLALARSLVELHNGTIYVKETARHSNLFIVELPLPILSIKRKNKTETKNPIT